MAKGDVARQFNALPAGAKIQVTGWLEAHCWKTDGGQSHRRIEIHVKSVRQMSDVSYGALTQAIMSRFGGPLGFAQEFQKELEACKPATTLKV